MKITTKSERTVELSGEELLMILRAHVDGIGSSVRLIVRSLNATPVAMQIGGSTIIELTVEEPVRETNEQLAFPK